MMSIEMTEIPEYELIRYKIERVGITRPKLAEMLDIDISRLNNYLYGRIKLDKSTLRYLTGFLDTMESIESVYSKSVNYKNSKGELKNE